MRFSLPQIHVGKKTAFGLAAAAVVGVAASSVNIIGSNQMALQETLGSVTTDILKPGFRFTVPLIQFTHIYKTNTQKIDFVSGSSRWGFFKPSTSDQNVLMAEVVLNYKVQANEQNLIYHRWAMRSWWGAPDGYFLLTQLLNDSTNAVMGRQTMAQTIGDPATFEKDLYQDLTTRLQLNNVPVDIESLELKKIKTFLPTKVVSYSAQGLSGPPQLPKALPASPLLQPAPR